MLIFLGAPGSGKGTQSQFIINEFNYTHFSTGDALRKEIQSGSELGKEIEAIISGGNLVDDKLVLDLVYKSINNKLLLDGYPRTVEQARDLQNIVEKNNIKILVIYIEVNEDECIRRIINRNHGRQDDNAYVAKQRYSTFKNHNPSIVKFYKDKGVLKIIDGMKSKDKIKNEIFEVIKEFIN